MTASGGRAMLQPRRRTARLMLAAALVMALGAASCGDDDDTPGTGSTSPSTESTTTTLSPEEEVKAAYLAFWDMFVRLAQEPNPDDPEIPQRASGQTLGNVVDGLSTLRSLNRRSVFGPQYIHSLRSVSVRSDGTALVTDCAVDDSRIVDASTGETIEQGVVTELSEVTLLRGESGWLVDHSTRLNAWEGAVECD